MEYLYSCCQWCSKDLSKESNPPIMTKIDNLNYVQQTDGNPDTTQFGSFESSNIVELDELKELKVWFEDCIKDYLIMMTLDYKEFWIHESWINHKSQDKSQGMHNHCNSLISGVYYIEFVPQHPP